MTIVYVLGGLVCLIFAVIGIMGSLAMIKTQKLLQEIVDSGAIPSLYIFRLKEEANSMLSGNKIINPASAINLKNSLKEFKDDKEAQELARKLSEIKTA